MGKTKQWETHKSCVQVCMPKVEVWACDKQGAGYPILRQSRHGWGTGQHRASVLASPGSGHLQAHSWAARTICCVLFAASSLFLLHNCLLLPRGGRGTGNIADLLVVYCPCPIKSTSHLLLAFDPGLQPSVPQGLGSWWLNFYDAPPSFFHISAHSSNIHGQIFLRILEQPQVFVAKSSLWKADGKGM